MERFYNELSSIRLGRFFVGALNVRAVILRFPGYQIQLVINFEANSIDLKALCFGFSFFRQEYLRE